MAQRIRPKSYAASNGEDPGHKSAGFDRERFRWLENLHASRELHALDFRIALLLALQYTSMKSSRERFAELGRLVAWPSHAKLADRLGCSRQGVSAALRRMVGLGVIEVLEQSSGRGHAITYALGENGKQGLPITRSIISNAEHQKRQLRKSEKATGASEKGKQRLPHSLSSSPKRNTPIDSQGGDDRFYSGEGEKKARKDKRHPEFNLLFDAWPNPTKDYDKSLGAWIIHVLKRKHDPDRVLDRARIWIEHWEDTGATFLPYLGKWLKDQGWRDLPVVEYPPEIQEMVAAVERRSNPHTQRADDEGYDELAIYDRWERPAPTRAR